MRVECDLMKVVRNLNEVGGTECKAPEKGGCSASWRSSQAASVALGVAWVMGRRGRTERGRRGGTKRKERAESTEMSGVFSEGNRAPWRVLASLLEVDPTSP